MQNPEVLCLIILVQSTVITFNVPIGQGIPMEHAVVSDICAEPLRIRVTNLHSFSDNLLL